MAQQTESAFVPGLEGVVAFESTIAEPDREGGALRYRGVDINDLVGRVSFGNVWGLLVDDEFNPGLPPAEPFPLPVHTGDVRVDVQSALAQLAPIWGFRPLLDIDADQGPRRPGPRLGDGAVASSRSRRAARTGRWCRSARWTGRHHRRAVHDPLARRARPAPRRGGRRLLGLGGRARHERVDLHRPGDRLDRSRRGGVPVRRRGGHERPAARRRPLSRAAHDRGRGGDRRRRRVRAPACSTAASG